MYKTHFKSGDPHEIAKYKKYANKVNHLKEISKKNYFHDEIKNNFECLRYDYLLYFNVYMTNLLLLPPF